MEVLVFLLVAALKVVRTTEMWQNSGLWRVSVDLGTESGTDYWKVKKFHGCVDYAVAFGTL